MHPRNKYKQQPDFKLLALNYPEFRQFVTQDISGRFKVNFKDPLALRSLTKCLLHMDFGLEIDIPEKHLVPTVPQRLNYLLWVEDLLNILPEKSLDGVYRVIDLGTGPCCIFPLLGSKTQKWNFLASESNDEGYLWAKKNVEKNSLQNLINVVKVERDSSLLNLLENEHTGYDATMCNPPFFTDAKDADWEAKSRTKKRPPPNSCNPAHEEEIIFNGGEVAFVKTMITDSQILKDKVRIYTTMLGKKSSLKEIKHFLNEQKVFKPAGTVPKRATPVSFFIPSNLKGIDYTMEALSNKLVKYFLDFKFQFNLMKETAVEKVWVIKAKENTWSHQRRKRREQQRKQTRLIANDDPIDKSDAQNITLSNHDNRDSVTNGPKRKNDAEEAGSSKKPRIEDSEAVQDEFILDCSLTLKLVGKNFAFELLSNSSTIKKELIHQVLQFFKNKFS